MDGCKKYMYSFRWKSESTLLPYVEIMFSKALNSKQIQAWSTYPILSEHAHISFFKKIISFSIFPLRTTVDFLVFSWKNLSESLSNFLAMLLPVKSSEGSTTHQLPANYVRGFKFSSTEKNCAIIPNGFLPNTRFFESQFLYWAYFCKNI